MSSIPRSLVLLVLACALAAAIVGYAVREPIERAIVLQRVRSLTGLASFDAARIEREGDSYVFFDARASLPDGSLAFDAPKVRVASDGTAYAVRLENPRVRFDPFAYRDADRARIGDAFAASGQSATATLSIANGSLDVGPIAATAVLAVDTIDGSLAIYRSRATFAGSLVLESLGRGYPIVGNPREEDGTIVQTWTAGALPLAPFAGFLDASAPARPLDGFVRSIDIHDGARFAATAELADAKVSLGEHTLHGLHGKLVASGDGIGSPGLAGYLDSAPFRAVGEVHDLHSHYRWLAQGTSDLQSLAKLAAKMGAEPNVRGPVELEAIAPGLVFGQYHATSDHGPLAISILSADPTEKTLRLGTAIASDRVFSGGERTSVMGVRTGAVGGVNGDYFDIGRTYQPQGMLVRDGELVHGPTDRAVATIDRNMRVTFGESHMTGALQTARGSIRVSEFNEWPPGYVSVITPKYGAELPAGDATFVALDSLGGAKYRVRSITPGSARIPVRFGVAVGKLARVPLPKVGDTVRLSYGTDPPLGDVVAAIGGGPILLKDGLPIEDRHAPAPDERDYRWPVIALAQTKDARLDLVAVDGRHPERSVGMTRPDFAMLLERLGATDAMALDSGGSVTMVARTPGDTNVSVRNVPSDNSAERWISDALFLYSSAPRPSIVTPSSATTPLPEVRPSP